jgi:hypothetical protein
MQNRRIGILLLTAVLLVGIGTIVPALALWGDTGEWKKNVNVLKVRSDDFTPPPVLTQKFSVIRYRRGQGVMHM